MKINKCVNRTYYEDDNTYVVEVDLNRLVLYYRDKGSYVPAMEDVELQIIKELGLKKPFKILFMKG